MRSDVRLPMTPDQEKRRLPPFLISYRAQHTNLQSTDLPYSRWLQLELLYCSRGIFLHLGGVENTQRRGDGYLDLLGDGPLIASYILYKTTTVTPSSKPLDLRGRRPVVDSSKSSTYPRG